LKRRGVTLALLWQEYRAEHAQGYAYSWFCERYSDWRTCISPTMRQTHLAGEKLFVDWAGDTMPVLIRQLAKSIARTSSSRRLARPITPTPRRAGPRHCPIATRM
jgi:transposase